MREKILIAGFSGAGKTSLLKALEKTAPDPEWTFTDLDDLVIKQHRGQVIAHIVAEHGWETFRLWERQALGGWLKEEEKGVLSLGGGALTPLVYELYKGHRKLKFCHLHASFEDCWERLQLENTEARPLIKLGKGELHRIYLERFKVFDQIPWRLENPKGSDLFQLSSLFWKEVLT